MIIIIPTILEFRLDVNHSPLVVYPPALTGAKKHCMENRSRGSLARSRLDTWLCSQQHHRSLLGRRTLNSLYLISYQCNDSPDF